MAAQHHEVIEISDDSDSNDDTTRYSEPLQWSEVVDQLLLLAENRDLQLDEQLVARLLQKLDITPSRGVRNALRKLLDQLTKLLAFCHDHPRRLRAAEDLIAVICRVLSLAQTTPRRAPFYIKEELATGYRAATNLRIFQLIEPWITQLFMDGENREGAVDATISFLEIESNNCTNDIESLQSSLADQDLGKEEAALKWIRILERCQVEAEQEGHTPCDSEVEALTKAFNTTLDVQAKWTEHDKTRKALAHRSHEQHLRRDFYASALDLVILFVCHGRGGQQEPLRADQLEGAWR